MCQDQRARAACMNLITQASFSFLLVHTYTHRHTSEITIKCEKYIWYISVAKKTNRMQPDGEDEYIEIQEKKQLTLIHCAYLQLMQSGARNVCFLLLFCFLRITTMYNFHCASVCIVNICLCVLLARSACKCRINLFYSFLPFIRMFAHYALYILHRQPKERYHVIVCKCNIRRTRSICFFLFCLKKC